MATGMETVIAAIETVTDLVSSVFGLITSNPLLVVFLAASLVGVGIGVFQQLRGAAH